MNSDSSIQIEYRCSCGKLLFKGLVFRSSVEVKCQRCNRMNFFEGIGAAHNPNRFIALTNLEGKIAEISSSVKTALGYEPEEILGSSTGNFLTDESAKSDEIFAQKIIDRKYLRLDVECRRKNGKLVRASVCYKYFQNGQHKFLLKIFDIVPEINEKLFQGSKFKHSFFCDIVTETDEKGVLVYVERDSLKKFLGFRPEDVVGRKAEEFIANNVERKWRLKNHHMLLALKKAHRSVPGLKIINKKDQAIELESYSTPFYDDAGNFLGLRNSYWFKKPKK